MHDDKDKRLSRRAAIAITCAAMAAATVVVFGAVLPAEFNKDPLGLGRLTGLGRLWAPEEVAFTGDAAGAPLSREYPAGFRSDVINIPLAAKGSRRRGDSLEYKVAMKKDATLIYEWSADVADPNGFYADFHGETRTGAAEETVATYRQGAATAAAGALTAPFDGIHGWYVENRSSAATVVHIRISGFYELVPPGDPGNDSGITANVPAERAFDLPPELAAPPEPRP